MNKNEWHFIGKGFGGWFATGINVSSSGGDLDPYKWWADDHIVSGYRQDAIDGAFVYDASALEFDRDTQMAYITMSLKGPMLNPALDPEGWEKFGHSDDRYHAFDSIGTARYERFVRESIPSARFGHVQNGEVIWE